MLKIGEFSRLTQVPAKTLRYYDEIGLFKPAQVDKFTGYRYYIIAQLPRLYRIMALKALDLTLEQIQHMLDDDLSPEEMRGMLRLKQAELNQTIADVQMRLSYVAHKIQQVEEEETFMAKYEVILKDVPELKVAITEGIAPDMARLSYTLSTMFGSVAEYLDTQAVAPVGPAFAMYLDDEMMETNIRIATAFPIADNITGTDTIVSKTLPAIQAASAVHHGSFAHLQDAYGAILKWIAQHNYEIVGSPREISLVYDATGNPDDYVTEIQFPVMPRQA